MSTTTTNYGLVKPALTDPADITATNSNWDKIDSELKDRAKAEHFHEAADLPVVPIEKGGTGATSAANALKNLGINATADEINFIDGATSNIQEQLNGLADDIKSSSVQVASATSSDGVSYTATVENISELYAGLAVFFIPDKTSASTAPTFNLNALGAKTIRRKLSMGTSTTSTGNTNAWLYVGKPYLLVYDGTYWIVENLPKPCSTDLYGIVSVDKGGTGANNASDALANLGVTPANIGAAAASHAHNLQDLSGTLPITKGGTGATTFAGAQKALFGVQAGNDGADILALPSGFYSLPNDTTTAMNAPVASWSPILMVIGNQDSNVADDGYPIGAYMQMFFEWDGTTWIRRRQWNKWGTPIQLLSNADTKPTLSSTTAVDRTQYFNVGDALIQSGVTPEVSCANDAVTSYTITFPKSFSSGCTVIASLYYNNTNNSLASKVTVAVGSYSNSSMTILFSNTSGGARNLRASWIAMGQ